MRGLSLQLPIVSAKNSAAIVGQCWLPIAATWAGAAAALRGGIEVIGLRVPALADGGGVAAILIRRFEDAASRKFCCWLALSCSMLALSCSTSCPRIARSRAID